MEPTDLPVTHTEPSDLREAVLKPPEAASEYANTYPWAVPSVQYPAGQHTGPFAEVEQVPLTQVPLTQTRVALQVLFA